MQNRAKYQRYTLEEIDYVKKHYHSMKLKELSKTLKIPVSGIVCIARKKLKIKKQKSISLEQEKEVVRLYTKTTLTIKQITQQLGLTRYLVSKTIKKFELRRNALLASCENMQKGWKQGKLLNGYSRYKNKVSNDRHRILYAYRHCCYDCKKKLEKKQLVVHHDFNELPIKVFALCRKCHLQRHK